jgi:SAM-dependent methyltransferase
MGSSKERKSNLYDSAYLAEYYDISTRIAQETVRDARFYTSALRGHLQAYSPLEHHGQPIVVLDVGTGTGRVLLNLAYETSRTHDNLNHVQFIGIDREPAMIHYALAMQQKYQIMKRIGRIDWLVGEAVHMISMEILQNHIGRVDLIIFAAGSVSYLTGPDEPLKFFTQVAALLRPGSGRFYLSVRDDLISSRSITDDVLLPRNGKTLAWPGLHEQQVTPSALYAGVLYYQQPVEDTVIYGPLKTNRFRVQAIRRTGFGDDEILEDNLIETTLRVWNETEMLNWAEEAGLKCLETFHEFDQTYYVLGR